jgi:hypothetical protein
MDAILAQRLLYGVIARAGGRSSIHKRFERALSFRRNGTAYWMPAFAGMTSQRLR